MTEIRNVYGKVIVTGEGTVAEVVAANKADLSEANLRWADLSEADLRGANLSGANLSGANLRGANPGEANLRGANLRGANLSCIPAPLVLLARWGELPDALTLDLMRYDASNHPEPTRFVQWGGGGPCPYSGLPIARAANFQERRELIGPDFLSLPVKSAWQLVCELAEVKGFRFAPEEDR